MKKKLNVAAIENELRGGSAFFPSYTKEETQVDKPVTADPTQAHTPSPKMEGTTSHSDTVIPRHHDTTTPRHHDTITPDDSADDVEIVRRAVKQIGKEAATHRFTVQEKAQLADIEYTYRRQGIKTTENEITRIATNYFIEDYRKNGEESVLAKVLKKLNS